MTTIAIPKISVLLNKGEVIADGEEELLVGEVEVVGVYP
jgi:hypothetical protein